MQGQREYDRSAPSSVAWQYPARRPARLQLRWTPPWNCCKPWPQRFPRIHDRHRALETEAHCQSQACGSRSAQIKCCSSRYAHTEMPALITYLLLTAWQTGIAPVAALRLPVPIFGVDWPLAPSLAAPPRWGPTPLHPGWSACWILPEHGGWRNCDHPHADLAPDGRWVPAGTPLRFWIELGFKALKPPGLPPAEDPPQQRREAESYVHLASPRHSRGRRCR